MKNHNTETITVTYTGCSPAKNSTSVPNSVYYEVYFTAKNNRGQEYRFYVAVDTAMNNFADWDPVVQNAVPGDRYEVLPFADKAGNPHLKKGMWLCDADHPPKYIPNVFETLFK